MCSKDIDQILTMTVIKEDKDTYSYNVEVETDGEKEGAIKGKIETEKEEDSKDEQKGKTTITMNITEVGTIKLEVDYSAIYNQGIDTIDTSNSINMEELTEEDIQSMIDKLKERHLIGDLIDNMMNVNSSAIDDFNNFDSDSSSNLTTSQNQVEAYGYLVTYSVPEGFEYESNYSYDSEKYYTRESDDAITNASVEINWDTYDEVVEDIKWDYDYYNESEYYENVSLSEERTINVGGNEFKYQVMTYSINDNKYENAYVCYELDDSSVFKLEIGTTNVEITEELISSFLNIQIQQVDE